MASQLRHIGSLEPKKASVLFIPGGMATPPLVFDGIERMIPIQSAQIDWSKSAGPWDVRELGNRVLEFIVERDLGPTIVAGYSAGGVIAQQAAIADDTGRIIGLLLSNTGPCAIGHGDPDLPSRVLEQWFSEELYASFLTRCFSREIATDLREKIVAYAKTVELEVVYQSAKTLRENDLRPYLQKIHCPVVIAHGVLDKTRTEEHVNMLVKGIADTEVFYLNGGHTVMVEDRDNWVKALNHLIHKTIGIC